MLVQCGGLLNVSVLRLENGEMESSRRESRKAVLYVQIYIMLNICYHTYTGCHEAGDKYF